MFKSPKFVKTFCLLIGLMLIVLTSTACGGFMTLWTVGNVALGAVGVALAALGSVLSPGQVSAITSAVAKVQALWNDLKTVVSDYISNAAEASLDKVNQVVTDLQAALPDVEAAANIGNPVVKAVIAAVLAATGDVLSYLAANILPKATAAKAAFTAHDEAPAKLLDSDMKLTAAQIKAKFESDIANSGLDADTVQKLQDNMEHETHMHLGPFRV